MKVFVVILERGLPGVHGQNVTEWVIVLGADRKQDGELVKQTSSISTNPCVHSLAQEMNRKPCRVVKLTHGASGALGANVWEQTTYWI
uniref:Uncharacterized protein n=1 Tax=Arion vulgaris TaxID=1028688 RepID=A0A0B7BM08_9EUPU